MNNLIVNAIKFAPQGSKVIVRSENCGQEIRISVTDAGIGISKQDQKNIFAKFYNSCDVAARKNRGCGLGLAITKGLVEAQKGRIWVESEYGKGSSFYFTLPFCANE